MIRAEYYETLPQIGRQIREEVFMTEQGFSYDYDETDEVAVHFVLWDGENAVAACRAFRGEEEGVFVLGRLAVKKECRGKKLGSTLLGAVADYVKNQKGRCIILHSQLDAKDFYSKNGFSEYGEIEYEEDCPHIWMKKEI